ncbi:ABC transporter permease [Paenibacillus zanthoxyli]|uniref:ABC transporter permease n=1 Tax=Paenibacillus zanthoxyli TaxID=369399 RepID=UPI00047196FF|nr:ABC transporter permease subunit [Paenibacillus zanthoxyli]
MDGLRAGLKNELLLMIYRKKTMFFFLVSVLIPVLFILLFHALHPILGRIAVSPSYPVQMLEIYTVFLIPLFMFVEIADLFPQEISSRTLKLALLRPITRLGAYLAKFLALGVAIGILLLLLGTVSTLCNILFGIPGTGNLDIFGLLKAYAAAFLSMLSLAALFIFIAQFFRSAGGFLVFSILLYTGAKAVPYFINGFSFFSITSYTDWYSLWLSHTVSTGRLVTTSLFLLSSLLMFLTIGYILFDRKEV